ncbi:MAG: hypothetical protein US86_C0001G0256 [Candidatus Daviesbacteria bacterium GW2011_GWA2_38_24]|uniref:Major facilitator superfamily (MFS) profile domain-containing protein n=1 Tax=Candidatus Daviesbacteria bacterium GW2011_GWA2_38_24 TaxID=1618422 RepID=A0A0G0M100_9BACT|nr:MAG: hypothetical protein US86_C0001G0256 [Candidatus Daviesbacteria bacterium GW2011_GWA2_38_24]KKQ80389.1 MAG: hypothetical protein UT01_C0013G0012 [Candidatus Daviesbacteria bacterium GW2011_GWA1_38_7]OGE24714.1 MAG: hypothetical protein A2688_01745 [Candidatus Daviesbacteria bacterium RIFCSPHIGHO2_01_FULL_38_8]
MIPPNLNLVVKFFIMAESLIWSAWNLSAPIFAVFVTNRITGGSVQIAATMISVYLFVRVVLELLSSSFLSMRSLKTQVSSIVVGILLLSLAYVGFAFSKSVFELYLGWVLAGIGMGISAPIKGAIFSKHLDGKKEALEWGIHDAVILGSMAVAAAVGGTIASNLGFRVLFILASIVNLLGIFPYFVMYRKIRYGHWKIA